MNSCVFCKIVSGEEKGYKVFENEHFLAFLDRMPVNPGHVLLIPKRHTDYAFDLESDEYTGLFKHACNLEPALRKATGAPKLGVVLEGFGVPHVHLHLIPIFGKHEVDPNRARQASEQELIDVHAKILKVMEGSVG